METLISLSDSGDFSFTANVDYFAGKNMAVFEDLSYLYRFCGFGNEYLSARQGHVMAFAY